MSPMSWHERLRKAWSYLYGAGGHGEYFDAVDLDEYRSLTPRRAVEKIVRDVRKVLP